MNSRYEVIIFWSDEDGSFVAEVPELPGCMADGRTYQEAVAHAEVAIQQWTTQPVNSVALFPSRGVGFITHNNRFVPTCPPDPPRFLLEQMVHEMVAEDRRDAEKDELCKREGYRVFDYYE